MVDRLNPWATQKGVSEIDGVLSRLAPVLEKTIEVEKFHSINIISHHDVLKEMKTTLIAIREALPQRQKGLFGKFSQLVGWLW